mmetsp:Transcript_5412/g.18825  ORF Transcript_5412/g.18825 Transcript_5412/m.18825 type:complete len:82 (+) Transcript_5412:97-342(+)
MTSAVMYAHRILSVHGRKCSSGACRASIAFLPPTPAERLQAETNTKSLASHCQTLLHVVLCPLEYMCAVWLLQKVLCPPVK